MVHMIGARPLPKRFRWVEERCLSAAECRIPGEGGLMAVATAVDFGAKLGKLFEMFDRQALVELTAMFGKDAQGGG